MPTAAPIKNLPVLTDVVDLNKISSKQAVMMCLAIVAEATKDDAGVVPGRHNQAHIIACAVSTRIVSLMRERFGIEAKS